MCKCGCNTCEVKAVILTEQRFSPILSEGIKYHIKNNLPLTENLYRYGSNAFLSLWKEARYLYSRGAINVGEQDKDIIVETDLGEFGVYEGKVVALDMPFAEVEQINEIDMNAPGVKDVLRILYKDQELLDKLGFKDIRNVMKFLKWGTRADLDDIRYDIEQIKQGKLVEPLTEAKKAKRKNPPLNKPHRGGPKKFYVYVRNPKTKKIKKVNFGDAGNLKVKLKDPKARKAFAARHKCAQKTDKTTPGYWSCRIGRYWKSLGGDKNFSGYW